MENKLQLKAIAELDGWKEKYGIERFDANDTGLYPPNCHLLTNLNQTFKLPHYLTSRDAIVPVIQNQTFEIKTRLIKWLDMSRKDHPDRDINLLCAAPSQLCEALL